MTESPTAASATIRNRSGIVWLVVVGALAVFLLVDVAARGGFFQVLLLAPWLLLPIWVVLAFLVLPALTVDDRGVLVRNPFRRTAFGWSRVREVDSRWQIGFRLVDGRSVQAFGAPLRRGRAAASDSGELDHVLALRNAGTRGDDPVVLRWNLGVLAALAVLLVWAAVAVAVTR